MASEKITAIIESVKGLTVLELKELIDTYCEEFGVSAVAAAAPAAEMCIRDSYWAELVRPVRQKAFNWKRNDSNRAAALREAKANQELAKMGQMAQQIAEALARNP